MAYQSQTDIMVQKCTESNRVTEEALRKYYDECLITTLENHSGMDGLTYQVAVYEAELATWHHFFPEHPFQGVRPPTLRDLFWNSRDNFAQLHRILEQVKATLETEELENEKLKQDNEELKRENEELKKGKKDLADQLKAVGLGGN